MQIIILEWQLKQCSVSHFLIFTLTYCTQTAFTTKKDYGRGEREAQWATAQRTLHGLQAPGAEEILNEKSSYRELSEIAEQAKKRAEVARYNMIWSLVIVNMFVVSLVLFHEMNMLCMVYQVEGASYAERACWLSCETQRTWHWDHQPKLHCMRNAGLNIAN